MEVATLIRVTKPALTLLAALVVILASACSSSATTAPGGAGGPTGAPTSAASVANPNDPNGIIASAISTGTEIKSFHIKIEVAGTIKAAALQDAAGSSGSAITSDVKLDGAAIEGDVDVVNQAANLSFNVPPLAMLGNQPLTGDLILKDSVLYYKISLLGPKYTKMALGSLTGGLPVTVPTPGASAMAGVADELKQLQAAMDDAGVKVTLVGVESIGGKDAEHINISIPLDKLNAEIAKSASSDSPAITIDSASADVWVYKDNHQLAKIELKGASSALGDIDFIVTITNYDAAVTITAPPASQIQPSK
jgi:hypothetical protein